MENFDVAVIGAGPAGMMAAGQAANLGLKVVLLEKNTTAGKKLLLTGNGRCNLTNLETNLKTLADNYNNGEFLFRAFSLFGPEDTVKFFNNLGIKTKIENNKRVFPASNSAQEVLEALENYLAENKVKILFNCEVLGAECKAKKITKLILKNGEISAKKYILCAGGKSFPMTGSAGFGFELAEKMGHTVTKPSPALCPVSIKEKWVKNLQGISLKDVKISVFQNNKKQFSETGEIIFTHFGLSGPAIINFSGKLGSLLEKGETKIIFDFFPVQSHEGLLKEFEKLLKKYPNKSAKNVLAELVPERLAETLLEILQIDKNKISNNMSKLEKEAIIKTLKSFEVTAENILGFEQAMATRGGISLKEIDHKTMQSKIIKNLFFAGEILDVDGRTGGFNLQLCWSTGFVAGKSFFNI
jgi:predicted Rossmann fold flavoprotein